MAERLDNGIPNDDGVSPIPTIALRGGLSGLFVDFDHLPALLADMCTAGGRQETVSRWSALLESMGFDARHIDPEEYPVLRSPAVLAAEGAWRLAERMGFIEVDLFTEYGREVAGFAGLDTADVRKTLAPMLAQGVESALVGQDGIPIVPLLRRAADRLAETTNLWARECPGLVPAEVGAIVHWACVDAGRAGVLVRDIEINRDVAMHRFGPPDPDAPLGANAVRHFERVSEFYLEHPHLGERVPLSFGEETALTRLLGYCGLFQGRSLERGTYWLALSRDTSKVARFLQEPRERNPR